MYLVNGQFVWTKLPTWARVQHKYVSMPILPAAIVEAAAAAALLLLRTYRGIPQQIPK